MDEPEANSVERRWRAMRSKVTHHHHRAVLADLYQAARTCFAGLDAAPIKVLANIGRPFALTKQPSNSPFFNTT